MNAKRALMSTVDILIAQEALCIKAYLKKLAYQSNILFQCILTYNSELCLSVHR